MVLSYWPIAREIVQDLQEGNERAAYGKRVLAELSRKLQARYGEGYSLPNLRQFREFYENQCAAAGWTKRELERHIHSLYHERLLFGDEEFYVDLVFYNYLLKCLLYLGERGNWSSGAWPIRKRGR